MKIIATIVVLLIFVFSGCANVSSDVVESVWPDVSVLSVENRGLLPTMTNPDGTTLRIGMSHAEYELLCQRIYHRGGILVYPNIKLSVLSVGDVIIWLSPGEGWLLDNGVKRGMPVDEVRELLGEEDTVVPPDIEDQFSGYRIFYGYEDGAIALQYFDEDNEIAKAGTISSIVLYSYEYDESKGFDFGQIFLNESGVGNAIIGPVIARNLVTYTFNHDYNEGAIKVYFIDNSTGEEYALYRADSPAMTTVIWDDLQKKNIGGKLRIETEGQWSALVRHRDYMYLRKEWMND